jgi:hypothetical protein
MIIMAAIATASFAATTGPAFAQGGGAGGGGGGNGGGKTAPAPSPTPGFTLCPEFASSGPTSLADGSILFANEIPGDVACVIVRDSPTGSLSLEEVRLGTGWTASIKSSGGGSSNKIDVTVTNRTTGGQHEFVIAPGKADIR